MVKAKGLHFKKKKSSSEEVALQITSMADIFTIILVFLLKSYASGAAGEGPNSMMQLPASASAKDGDAITDILKIEINETSLSVNQTQVAKLSHYAFGTMEQQKDGPSLSPELDAALKQVISRQKPVAQIDSSGNAPAVAHGRTLAIYADQNVPYSTLKTVFATVSKNGYQKFKLAVVKPE